MNAESIEKYEAGADILTKAIEGLTDAQLIARPIAGTWNIREIILHLMDSDAVGVDRMKRVIAMPNPLLMSYDENAFMSLLDYSAVDIRDCIETFRLNRLQLVSVLKKLPKEAFQRSGIHSETGKQTLAQLLLKYVHHLEGHMVHLRKKRTMVEHI